MLSQLAREDRVYMGMRLAAMSSQGSSSRMQSMLPIYKTSSRPRSASAFINSNMPCEMTLACATHLD